MSAWANGRGTTRELARGSSWRLSIAELTEDAPFSAFPGFDRLFILVSGRVRLIVDGEVTRMKSGDTLTFSGEADVGVAVDDPAQAVNLMVGRGGIGFETRSLSGVLDLTPDHGELIVLTSPALTADGDDLEPGSTWAAAPAVNARPPTLHFATPVSVQRVLLSPR